MKSVSKMFRLVDFHTGDQNNLFTVQLFGINEIGETVSITVRDFKPFFYIQVGDRWTDYDAGLLAKDIAVKIKKPDITIDCKICKHKPLYGYAPGETSTFVRIEFLSMSMFRQTIQLWYRYDETGNRIHRPFTFQNTVLKLYESSFPRFLLIFNI